MNRPATQINPEQAQAQLQAQINQARAVNAMKAGLEFLIDEKVIGPIKYSDGLADLKWMLRGLLSGQFGLSFDIAADRGPPTDQVKGRPLDEYDETGGSGAGANSEGVDKS